MHNQQTTQHQFGIKHITNFITKKKTNNIHTLIVTMKQSNFGVLILNSEVKKKAQIFKRKGKAKLIRS
jgi:hypothetical protein